VSPNVKAISIAEAAEAIGVVPLTIQRLIKRGALRASRVGRRVVIKLADLDKFLADNEVQTARAGKAVRS
jgi:excisionase family DNA binding protein